MGSPICFCIQSVLRYVIMVDATEENTASHRYVVGKERSILIALSGNCGYIFFYIITKLNKW